jgi:hypothetical protein
MRYAIKVEHAAAMKTVLKLLAYESLAARCSGGGSCATNVAECRIPSISYPYVRIKVKFVQCKGKPYLFGSTAYNPFV